MDYLISFLEGLYSFISPCILPMLPMYLSYFSGSNNPENRSTKRTLLNVFAFIAGFSLLLFTLGVFSGLVGKVLVNQFKQSLMLRVVSGLLVILFGLVYLDVLPLPFLQKIISPQMDPKKLSRLTLTSSFLFGLVFSLAWSPCVTPFLGAALTLSAGRATMLQGGLIMLFYSLGLGLPFLLSALLMDQLTSVFAFIKKHYRVVQIISGGFLILTGITMITGHFQKLLSALTF